MKLLWTTAFVQVLTSLSKMEPYENSLYFPSGQIEKNQFLYKEHYCHGV